MDNEKEDDEIQKEKAEDEMQRKDPPRPVQRQQMFSLIGPGGKRTGLGDMDNLRARQPVSGYRSSGAVIKRQGWADNLPPIPGCPPGLEHIMKSDSLFIQQTPEMMEMVTGWETNNKYKVLNYDGEVVYYALENTSWKMRMAGPGRGFTINIWNKDKEEVIRITREFKCCAGGCCSYCVHKDSCAHEIEIQCPVGQTIGYIRQEYSRSNSLFSVRDGNRNPLHMISGNWCVCMCPCTQNDLQIFNENDDEIGVLRKTKNLNEFFTGDANNFRCSYPEDLDVISKVRLLAGVFLIDFMFFEQNQNQH